MSEKRDVCHRGQNGKFDTGYGGNLLLQNICIHLQDTVSQPRGPQSEQFRMHATPATYLIFYLISMLMFGDEYKL